MIKELGHFKKKDKQLKELKEDRNKLLSPRNQKHKAEGNDEENPGFKKWIK